MLKLRAADGAGEERKHPHLRGRLRHEQREADRWGGTGKGPAHAAGGGRRGATSTRQQQTNTSKRGNEDRTYRQLSVILRNGGNGLIVQHREKRTKDGERERNRTNM